jgi:hypothetical protein
VALYKDVLFIYLFFTDRRVVAAGFLEFLFQQTLRSYYDQLRIVLDESIVSSSVVIYQLLI